MGKAFLPCLVSITSPSSLANLDMPKSAILHSLLWSTRTFLAARSRWMICAERTGSPNETTGAREVHVPLRVRLLTGLPAWRGITRCYELVRPVEKKPWARARARLKRDSRWTEKDRLAEGQILFQRHEELVGRTDKSSNISPPIRPQLLESEIWEDQIDGNINFIGWFWSRDNGWKDPRGH